MMLKALTAFIVGCWLGVAPIALADQSGRSDEFTSLSLRSGGPS
jgi:hypothetical protein